MPTIENLNVSLTARTGQFESGMARSTRAVDRLSAAVGLRASPALARMGALMAGIGRRALAGGGLVALTGVLSRLGAQSADRMRDVAMAIGATSEELSTLRFIAGQTGLSFEAMDKALVTLQKNAGDAAAGMGRAKPIFESLGIDAAKFVALPIGEKVGVLADRINALATPAERLRVTMRLFGEDPALVNTLAQGSVGFAAMAKQAKATGQVLSSLATERIANMNDAMDRLWTAIKNTFINALAVAAPVIERMADALTPLIAGLGRFLEKIAALAASGGVWSVLEFGFLKFQRTVLVGIADMIDALSFGLSEGLLEGTISRLDARIADLDRQAEKALEEARRRAAARGPSASTGEDVTSARDNRFLRGEIDTRLVDPSALSRARPVEVQSSQLVDALRDVLNELRQIGRQTVNLGVLP